jgi:hypothetical protein
LVDADAFLETAEKWLKALKTFASEQGKQVTWQITDLRKSSAFMAVAPVTIKGNKPTPALVKKWEQGLRKIENTGRPASGFTPASLVALKEFVSCIPQDMAVTLDNYSNQPLHVTALTQRRVEEASRFLPVEKREYSTRGSIRGRLAVLNSWKQDERFFTLQIPLAPTQQIRCTYTDSHLVERLGTAFEGPVEITGKLQYQPDRPWPVSVEVEAIRPLNRTPVGLQELAGLIALPNGVDSVAYVRGLRDE